MIAARTWINDLSPTNLKALTGCIMALILCLFFCIASYNQKHIDWLAFGEICGFAAAFAGIAGWSFSTMRKTDYGYLERKGEADAKIAAATAAPNPVVNVDQGASSSVAVNTTP